MSRGLVRIRRECSPCLGATSPNGWTFGLPNEVFFTPEGTAFDGPGIPPDIHVEVFAAADVAAGKDPGMAKALEILRNGGNIAVHDGSDYVYNVWIAFYSTDGSK
jgi:C-terminal processing protease CtpA/Prc